MSLVLSGYKKTQYNLWPCYGLMPRCIDKNNNFRNLTWKNNPNQTVRVVPQGSRRAKRATLLLSHAHNKTAPILPRTDSRRIRGFVELCVYHVGTSFVFDMSSPDIEIYWAQHVTGWEFLLIGDSLDFLGQFDNRTRVGMRPGRDAAEGCRGLWIVSDSSSYRPLVPSAVTLAQLGSARAPANPIPAPAPPGETQIWLWHFWHWHSWRIWGLAVPMLP